MTLVRPQRPRREIRKGARRRHERNPVLVGPPQHPADRFPNSNIRSRVRWLSISNSTARRRHACSNGLSSAPDRTLPGSRGTMQQTSPSSLSVDDLLITSDLKKRSRQRPHDRATISALQVLSRDISGRPSEALPRLVEMAKELWRWLSRNQRLRTAAGRTGYLPMDRADRTSRAV